MVGKKGVLLINLGTPNQPNKKLVKKYLSEFLMDKSIISMPFIFRYLLVNGIIVPLRSKKSALAYQSIWCSKSGSPLMYHSMDLASSLQKALGTDYIVKLAMRYGLLKIEDILGELLIEGCEEIIIIPLFPQYSSATTGSVLIYINQVITKLPYNVKIQILKDFYKNASYIKALSKVASQSLISKNIDKLVISFHGLPQSMAQNPVNYAQYPNLKSCILDLEANNLCYYAQCMATSQALALELNLDKKDYVVAFQSKMGWGRWLEPYTCDILPMLLSQGCNNIAVICPSFVVDCLETVEEIGIQLRRKWQNLGGNQLYLIPCLNDHPVWIKGLQEMTTI